jgi:hypothetical protein
MASKIFACYCCHKKIDVGFHYWRIISKYKYCDDCFISMLLRNGYALSLDSFGLEHGIFIKETIFCDRNMLSLEAQREMLMLIDLKPKKISTN